MMIVLSLVALLLGGCSPPTIGDCPQSVDNADLIGTWSLELNGRVVFDPEQQRFLQGRGVLTLALLSNGTYKHYRTDKAGMRSAASTGEWRKALGSDGCRQVLLAGPHGYLAGLSPTIEARREVAFTVESNSKGLFGGQELVLCIADPDASFCFRRRGSKITANVAEFEEVPKRTEHRRER